ncbi:hypothetical protein Golomagni_01084 [Golovinomyces magnicellulatus]|nr:hypothetical protein Golomagni_01084 [Golovinomyces magnicellulatus]
MAPISTGERRDVNPTSFLSLSKLLKERRYLRQLSETYTPPIIPTLYSDNDTGLGPGATASIVIGSVCGVLCISWLLYICFIKDGRGNSPPSKPSKRTAQRGQRKRENSKYTRPRTKNPRSRYQPKPKPKPKAKAPRPVSRARPAPVPQNAPESRKEPSEIRTLEHSSLSQYPEKPSDSESNSPSRSNEIVVIEEICIREQSKSRERSSRRSRDSRRAHNTTEPFTSQTPSHHLQL